MWPGSPPVDQDPHQDHQAQDGEGGDDGQGDHGLPLPLTDGTHSGLMAAVAGVWRQREEEGEVIEEGGEVIDFF